MLLENTPFFSAMLVAAGMSGIVPVGLNPVRRGEALARDIGRADCQLVLADSNSAATLGDIEHLNVDSAEWADEVAAHRDAECGLPIRVARRPVHADFHVGHQW